MPRSSAQTTWLGQTMHIAGRPTAAGGRRSEEHTSELQSHVKIVCRLLLEKKNMGTGQVVIQIVADRTSEVRTLQVLVAALVIGGLLVIAASVVVGCGYARGAFVPMRESLR